MIPLNIPQKLAETPKDLPKYQQMVKNMGGKDITLADPKATRAFVALMNQNAVTGGAAAHWGGPAAFAEIMSSIHELMFKESAWYKSYNFVNDAGHTENGVYALRANYKFDDLTPEDLFKFRSIESKLTGHGEAHLNPEGVYISNGPLGSGLPQAQGLAIADKLLKNDRVTICTISDGASMEGEAKESFAAIPGFAKKGLVNPFLMVVSDNNTKLGGRIDEDSFSMNPTFDSLATLGWKTTVVQNGNDLQEVYLAIEKGLEDVKKDPSVPVALIVKTVKGFGIKSTMEASSGGHGYPIKPYSADFIPFLEEIYEGKLPSEFLGWAHEILKKPVDEKPKTKSDVVVEKVQPGFAKAAIRATKEGLPVFSISTDLQGSTGIAPFHKEFPERFLDVGVAESNMISTAVGLSKQGMIPIVDTFAQFGITKGNLPLIMASLSQAPVIGLFSHTGFQDAADGASHQATTYLAAVSAIPHITCVQVSCSSEAESLMYQALTNFAKEREAGKTPNSVLFFLGRENFPAYYDKNMDYPWMKSQVYKKGRDLVIVSSGSMLPKALAAGEALEKEGVSATVINNSFVNYPDVETVKEALNGNGKLITIEDHQLIGGMGAQLVHKLKIDGVDFKLKSIGNNGKFGQSAYKADQLYDLHGMSKDGIIAAARELL
ncbi:MAG: transketolase [Epsilonproteobacteria bacterium]|nr:MAG: transketolase [Campylobacterota bacterium]RLA66790.1 MAG: transketolase [Campylobacterota bacterium]